MSRRIVITGMGWVTPLGEDIDQVWQRLLRAETAIGPVTRFEADSFVTNFAAEVKDFDLQRVMGAGASAHARAGISTKFALAAAARAWAMAGLGAPDGTPAPAGGFNPRRMGVYLG